MKKTRVGFFLGLILDISWGLVFWLSWLVLILGKFLKSHDRNVIAIFMLGLALLFAVLEATGAGSRWFVASSWVCTLRRGASGIFRLTLFRHTDVEYRRLIRDGED